MFAMMRDPSSQPVIAIKHRHELLRRGHEPVEAAVHCQLRVGVVHPVLAPVQLQGLLAVVVVVAGFGICCLWLLDGWLAFCTAVS